MSRPPQIYIPDSSFSPSRGLSIGNVAATVVIFAMILLVGAASCFEVMA